MDLLSIFLVAISLSMDSFSVSLAAGMCKRPYKKCNVFLFPFSLTFFQWGFFSLGWLLGYKCLELIESYDHWIAFGLLLFIGGRMIIDGIRPESKDKTFDPFAPLNMIILSVGTSIDALAVGIAFACSKEGVGLSGMVIGITTYICSFLGLMTGKYLGKKIKFPFDIVGGVILILIGMRILLTHIGIIH